MPRKAHSSPLPILCHLLYLSVYGELKCAVLLVSTRRIISALSFTHSRTELRHLDGVVKKKWASDRSRQVGVRPVLACA